MAFDRMTNRLLNLPSICRNVERQKWVERVSSPIEKTVTRLPTQTTDCSQPHCRRSARPVSMSAKAENRPRVAVSGVGKFPIPSL